MKNLTNKLFVGLAGLGVVALIPAQSPTWSTYSLTSTGANVAPVAMTEDSSGNIYVLGSTGGGNGNLVVMKFTSAGSLSTSAEFGSSTDSESASDIQMGPDGNLYLLGRTQTNKLYVQCVSTALSSVWVNNSVTAIAANGANSPSVVPYRLSIGGTSGTPITYATAQVQETGKGFVDLLDPVSAKAVFFAKFNNSGTTQFTGTWDGRSGLPDNLYGTHAVSNGMVFVTDTKQNVSGTDYSRTYYQKVDGSAGTVSWSSTPAMTAIVNRTHYLSQSIANGDNIYTGFGNLGYIPSQWDTNTYEIHLGVDGSRTTAPSLSDWSISTYQGVSTVTLQHNHSGGIGYWQGAVYGVGRGSAAVVPNTYYASWLRSGSSTYDSDLTVGYPFMPDANQRCYDASASYLSSVAATVSSTQFHFLTSKYAASPVSLWGTNTLTSGYSIRSIPQVWSSRVANSAYALLNVYDGSNLHRVALYKFDR